MAGKYLLKSLLSILLRMYLEVELLQVVLYQWEIRNNHYGTCP